MIITKSGYSLHFIQKHPCNDASSHLFTLVFKFYSPVTQLIYIVHADYHKEDVFAVKFYAKQHKKSDYKYSKIVNKGDVVNILITNAKVIPLLLKDYPKASFGFIGSRTVDSKSRTVEGYSINQRYRVYRKFVSLLIGTKTFEHHEFDEASGYLLLNKSCDNLVAKKKKITDMFEITYENILNIGMF